MNNKEIAKVFDEMADILEIQGASFFRVNAYRKGALTILNLGEDLRKIVRENPEEVEKIPGIGKALSEKIVELIETEKCQAHQDILKEFPQELLQLLEIRSLGPKKIKMFYDILGITTISELKKAAEEHKLRDLPKMGEKSETEILKAIEEHSLFSPDRHLIHIALSEAERYINYLKECKLIDQLQYAGSLRRWQETIGDIDLLAGVNDPEDVKEDIMKYFINYDEVRTIMAEGETKSSVLLNSGIQVDLRLVKNESFGAALHYFTGNKDHNVKIRDIAKKRGLKVNEYGLFDGEKKIAGETEESMFKALDLPYIPPELRKNDGEFEYAMKHGKMPKLIEIGDLKGDLHCHSTWSDGKRTIEEMLLGFLALGYEYFAITDHSKVVGVTNGMDDAKIRLQWEEIDQLNKKYKGKIRILKGCEVDILRDGSLDFSDEILKQLEVVVASAHMHARLDSEEQTKRLIKAIENPYVKILGHPTGRIINKRAEMTFDMEKIINACTANDVALEINASPARLDLTDKYIRMAKSKGAKFTIDTDSHNIDQMTFMKFGVGMARRGWLEKNDVINTRSLGSNLTPFT